MGLFYLSCTVSTLKLIYRFLCCRKNCAFLKKIRKTMRFSNLAKHKWAPQKYLISLRSPFTLWKEMEFLLYYAQKLSIRRSEGLPMRKVAYIRCFVVPCQACWTCTTPWKARTTPSSCLLNTTRWLCTTRRGLITWLLDFLLVLIHRAWERLAFTSR